eukprot:Opistho-2@19408
MPADRVALITGANTGIGLALAKRLATWHAAHSIPITICIGCRSVQKAAEAVKEILDACPSAKVDVLQIDVGNAASVLSAAADFRNRYARLDYLYLNAGIMPVTSINWGGFLPITPSHVFHVLSTGDGMLKQADAVGKDGLRSIFATNVFGHYVLVRELESLMERTGKARVIWTSSNAANKEQFSITDIQHSSGKNPYGSSKHAIDLLTLSLNERLNPKGITVYTMCPGLVMSQLTYNFLPRWFWTMLFPFFLLMRLFVQTLNVTPFNGAEALVHLGLHPADVNEASSSKKETVAPRTDHKYFSHCNALGHLYSGSHPLGLDIVKSRKLHAQLDALAVDFGSRRKGQSVQR